MNPLHCFRVLRVSGADARPFLQGQLSQDLDQLGADQWLLASCNSAQGRVQAVCVLLQRDADILLLVTAELAQTLLTRLRKYILRAKVTIECLDSLNVLASDAEQLAHASWPVPVEQRGHVTSADGQTSVLHWPSAEQPRYLIITSQTHPGLDRSSMHHDANWLLQDIRAGLPHVFTATHETFVAQMLNLDVLHGISFNKGCYTGQEIIARAHFRGAVKRRMVRLSAPSHPPAAGTKVLSGDSHAGEVVYAASTDTGCELLAVVNIAEHQASLTLDTAEREALTVLPLPYSLPV